MSTAITRFSKYSDLSVSEYEEKYRISKQWVLTKIVILNSISHYSTIYIYMTMYSVILNLKTIYTIYIIYCTMCCIIVFIVLRWVKWNEFPQQQFSAIRLYSFSKHNICHWWNIQFLLKIHILYMYIISCNNRMIS